jgi:hypothetical protein
MVAAMKRTVANHTMQRMRASRSRQSQFEHHWRLARPADGDCSAKTICIYE